MLQLDRHMSYVSRVSHFALGRGAHASSNATNGSSRTFRTGKECEVANRLLGS